MRLSIANPKLSTRLGRYRSGRDSAGSTTRIVFVLSAPIMLASLTF